MGLGLGLLAAGCRAADTDPAVTRLSAGPVAPSFGAGLVPSDQGIELRLAFADLRSRTVVTAVYPQPAGEGRQAVLDRVAEGAQTGDDLGALVYAVIADDEYLAYLDQADDGSLTLKQLRRGPADESWSVDIVQATGVPLGFVALRGDVRLLIDTGSGVDAVGVSPRIRGERREVGPGVRSAGRVSVVRREQGDTAALLDSATGRMVLLGWSGAGAWSIELEPPRGGTFGPVYHARRADADDICLFYYDPIGRELLDLRDLEGEPRLVKVTLAREVSAVGALTDETGTRYVYAEMTLDGASSLTPALTLVRVAPGAPPTMRRLATSAVPFRSLELLTLEGAQLVMAVSDSLYLYRS